MLSPGRRPATENVLPLLVLVLALFMRVVDRAGIQRDQVVEAAAVERQILYLALAHHAGADGVVVFTNGASASRSPAATNSPTSSRRFTTASWPTSRLIRRSHLRP